jgi:hypothetical protein
MRAARSSLFNRVHAASLAFLLFSMSVAVCAQQAQPGQAAPSAEVPQPHSGTQQPGAEKPAEPPPGAAEKKPPVHRFWDKQNDWLFAGVGAGRALDFASTRNARRRGLNEALLNNDIVDNLPAFAVIEAAATGASIGVSYLFHRKGHHSLERWTSYIHIGVAFFGAGRNYALKTPHPAAVP